MNKSPNPDATAVTHYGISGQDVEQVYCSPHCYSHAFEDFIKYSRCPTALHPTAGLDLELQNGRAVIISIARGTPCSKIPRWKTHLQGSTLLAINNIPVTSLDKVTTALATLPAHGRGGCYFTVSTPELCDCLTNKGIPQNTVDQLNPCHFFPSTALGNNSYPYSSNTLTHMINRSWDGDALHYLTRENKLTRGVLIKLPNWPEWQQSEFLQLNQYELQNMLGPPIVVSNWSAIFNLVWTYEIKEVDGRREARCTCDGPTRGGQVRILDYTHANSPDHTCSRLFYAVATAENLTIIGANVSNAFAEAKTRVLHMTQCSFPRLVDSSQMSPTDPVHTCHPYPLCHAGPPRSTPPMEKHADKILRQIGLAPTTHEPCLAYSNGRTCLR